jgi:hypothetical protein
MRNNWKTTDANYLSRFLEETSTREQQSHGQQLLLSLCLDYLWMFMSLQNSYAEAMSFDVAA